MSDERFSQALRSIGHSKRTQEFLAKAYERFPALPAKERSGILKNFREPAETLCRHGYPVRALSTVYQAYSKHGNDGKT